MRNMRESLAVLAKTFLFQGLSEEHLQEIAFISHAVARKKGAFIFREGEPGLGFYVIAQGKVKIFKTSVDGKEQILHIFGPGEPFGEAPVFHGAPFPATAFALSEVQLIFFPRAAFIEVIARQPSLALNMLALLSQRLRRFATQIEHLTLKEAPGRLASYLLYLAEEQQNYQEVVLDIPKGQLASLLGTSAETLSRIFAKMSEEGLIRVEGKRIYLANYEALYER